VSSPETETRFIRQLVVKADYRSRYRMCALMKMHHFDLHRKFPKFSQTCGATHARRRYYFLSFLDETYAAVSVCAKMFRFLIIVSC